MLFTTVGNNIRRAREKRNCTQEEAAFEADMQQSNWGSIELGKANPTLATLHRMAAALDVSLLDLFNEGGSLEPDYTTIGYFMKGGFPHINSSDAFEPDRLLEGLHHILLKKITLKDIRLIAREYYRGLTYEVYPHRYLDEENGDYLLYDLRLLYKKKNLFYIEEVAEGVCSDGEEMRKLARYMQIHHLSPQHFWEVVQNFCENDYRFKVTAFPEGR